MTLVLAVLAAFPAAAPAQGAFEPIDLDQRLYQYRDDHTIPIGRNVAVFEFEYPDKSRGTIAIDRRVPGAKPPRRTRSSTRSSRRPVPGM